MSKYRIMVVDDSRVICAEMKKMLEGSDIEIIGYCRSGEEALGLTVGVKLGKAVVRNRTRRRIKEAYRIHEGAFLPGYDIVVVARVRAAHSRYRELERSLLSLADKLGLLRKEGA